MKTGLVLEGGGLRGVYTIGVLDCLMDKGFVPNYLIGVSAGACNGASFVSGQRGRGLRIDEQFLTDERYLSWKGFLKTGSVFGMDFIFDEIANRLDPFDYDAFAASPVEYIVGVTDVQTGEAAYFSKQNWDKKNLPLRASISIPGFAPVVTIGGRGYLDGGIAAPIPVQKALEDGCERLVIVLTRDRSYRKSPASMRPVYHHLYRDYPAMIRAIERRHEIYNDTLRLIRKLERQGRAIVIAPPSPVKTGRFEREMKKLMPLYRQGMLDASAAFTRLAATV